MLSFAAEGAEGVWTSYELRFPEVVAFKCTYLHGLTAELIRSAYDAIVDMGSSPWLDEVVAAGALKLDAKTLRHLRVCFDDGPCYEFICAGFDVSSQLSVSS